MKDEAKYIKKRMDTYLSGNDYGGWGWLKTYGPAGAFSIIDQYEKKDHCCTRVLLALLQIQ